MRAVRPARLVPALLAAALLAGGCSSGGSSDRPAASTPPSSDAAGASAASAARASATPLLPLPAEIPAALAPYYAQQLSWRACDDDFECTTFKVPLDYADPAAGDFTLAAARKPASTRTGGRAELGSLLLNPGGPGSSAVEYMEAVAKGYDPEVRAKYDLVGLDPRGVGRSQPVTCLSNARMDAYTAVDITPDDQSEIDALVASDKEFAAGCAKNAGQVLGHVSTVESARDLEVLRALVGDQKLSYLGKSYGTFLGATYAGLHPTRVGRMVLDGAMDPALDAVAGNRTQAAGFETAWSAFAEDCTGRGADCPLGDDERKAGEQLLALFKQLDATPLPTDSARKLTEAQATTGVIHAMYAEFLWPQLRTAFASAKAGDGTGLLKLSDQYYERDADGGYPNLMYANMAVNCLDLPAPFTTPEQAAAAVPDFERASAHFGRDMAWMALACAYWSVPATGAPHTIAAAGAAPIVVVGTTRDPATPYAWAQSLADQLDSGRLLTYDGDGHTAYGRRNACVDGAVNRYLLGGEAPADGTRCAK
ncbi:alpha/beta hydrolase [Kitasatospora sp. NPDC096147]|uniref:alpha/beta hydrolase n=1 Tax=Kitasatospora sp. NPDC096147 TaxID=3364093 RepID=UPI0038182A3D